MGVMTRSKLDIMIEEKPWPTQDQDPYLVAALAAALVAYRRGVRQTAGQDPSARARSNWRIMSRMAQLQQRP